MGKYKYSKAIGFLHISCEASIHTISKIWEKWILIVRKKYGKKQIFQIYWFLKYFRWSRNPYNSQNMGKVNSHNTEKVWEKNKHSKVMGFSNILGEAEIHYSSQYMSKGNSHSKGKIWENSNISKLRVF